ncbi:Spy/CpxP family protein refolding chaperone [Chamaesiphon sp. VAR_69_metabat_338]|uniref:Spy/CpxP family protein refolding chaperone n=1 Tax=Chamaesiphon sp. VAR_69_metabat_338 TaxID=2964704 RepID=UPI00286DFA3A|nr:Spy/CpxP family protein refolding chaperone [Chamaesiphon sp. VAR_69_metabat_338]
MKNQLVKLLPLLAITIAAPAFATNNYLTHNAAPRQIAYGEINKNRIDDLKLTPAQQAKIAQLRVATRSQIEALMTPAQRQQLSQLQAQHQARRQAGEMGMMNLSTDQKAKIKAIRESNRSQLNALLTPTQQAQLTQGGGWRKGGVARLNLTSEQQTKFQQLRASARSQMAAVLTPEQQQQFIARHDRRQMGNSWKSLNLTANQQAQLRAIRQSSEQQLNTILTPEQQAQRKSHQGRYGKHHRHHSV